MRGHIRFWLWVAGMWVCDRLPGWTCWIHGGIVTRQALPFDDPCWRRAGWEEPA